jgi:hypothetical protein
MKKGSHSGFWRGFNVTAVLLIPAFLYVVPLLHAFEGFTQTVDMFLLQEAKGIMYGTSSVAVTIANTQHIPLNAVAFELSYNPQELSIIQISPSPTLCEERFMITNQINNASGTALFQCGTIDPFSGAEGIIATIAVQHLTSGTASLTFGTSTHVLAHDGYGTDVTRARNNLVLLGE